MYVCIQKNLKTDELRYDIYWDMIYLKCDQQNSFRLLNLYFEKG